MIRFALCASLGLAGCLSAVTELEPPGYHNPLDSKDGGLADGGHSTGSDGGTSSSQGRVLNRQPDLTSAVYFVGAADAGAPRTAIVLGDVAGLCGALQADGGLGDDWDLVRLRLAGDTPGTYPVAAALGPSGAVAGFEFRSDAGGFGTAVASSGTVELDALDPGNRQPSQGSYQLTFSPTESLSGKFSATPCAALAPAGGD